MFYLPPIPEKIASNLILGHRLKSRWCNFKNRYYIYINIKYKTWYMTIQYIYKQNYIEYTSIYLYTLYHFCFIITQPPQEDSSEAPRSGSEASDSDSTPPSPMATVASWRLGRRPQEELPGPRAKERSSLRNLGVEQQKIGGPKKFWSWV